MITERTRFMGSPLSFFRVHRGYKAPAGQWGSRPGCHRGRLARDGLWGETPQRQAGRLPQYGAG